MRAAIPIGCAPANAARRPPGFPAAQVTEAFVRAATEHRQVLQEQSHAEVEAVFQQVREYFGDFTRDALEQSSYMIDRLVERL